MCRYYVRNQKHPRILLEFNFSSFPFWDQLQCSAATFQLNIRLLCFYTFILSSILVDEVFFAAYVAQCRPAFVLNMCLSSCSIQQANLACHICVGWYSLQILLLVLTPRSMFCQNFLVLSCRKLQVLSFLGPCYFSWVDMLWKYMTIANWFWFRMCYQAHWHLFYNIFH